MPSAALPCDAQLSVLALCERRHPREKDLVCKALNAAAAWCLLKLRCPLEAADLEGCCGVSTKSSSRSSRTLQGPPTSVPRECQGAAARLEACLERVASEEEGSEQEEKKG